MAKRGEKIEAEIWEIDPETGEKDSLIGSGAWSRMQKSYRDTIQEKLEELDYAEIDYWPIFLLERVA